MIILLFIITVLWVIIRILRLMSLERRDNKSIVNDHTNKKSDKNTCGSSRNNYKKKAQLDS